MTRKNYYTLHPLHYLTRITHETKSKLLTPMTENKNMQKTNRIKPLNWGYISSDTFHHKNSEVFR